MFIFMFKMYSLLNEYEPVDLSKEASNLFEFLENAFFGDESEEEKLHSLPSVSLGSCTQKQDGCICEDNYDEETHETEKSQVSLDDESNELKPNLNGIETNIKKFDSIYIRKEPTIEGEKTVNTEYIITFKKYISSQYYYNREGYTYITSESYNIRSFNSMSISNVEKRNNNDLNTTEYMNQGSGSSKISVPHNPLFSSSKKDIDTELFDPVNDNENITSSKKQENLVKNLKIYIFLLSKYGESEFIPLDIFSLVDLKDKMILDINAINSDSSINKFSMQNMKKLKGLLIQVSNLFRVTDGKVCINDENILMNAIEGVFECFYAIERFFNDQVIKLE